uniref:CRISPR-associated Cas6 family protein n=1 Tax=uncultured prokaryote TaxID=198431 RepID=H5S984_9ZZZZ|nr:CRISPR-associated Cas6 family protein [uncultured prokaryote]
MTDFLGSLATHLISQRSLRLGYTELYLESLEVEPPITPKRPILVQALSPITVYSTLLTSEGKCKTYYYCPWEREFEALLLKNLQRKARVWYGSPIREEGHIRPSKVSPRDEHIVKFKDTIIKAWTGIYELDLPTEYLEMAYYAGLGAKNSQGFGCVALWQPPAPTKDLASHPRYPKKEE